jgi:acyl-coenzyme A synthetase/AMP-(fatty) acid ligase
MASHSKTPARWRSALLSAFDARDATKMLQDFVKAKLLSYKYPREVKFIDELPKTGTGKIDRQTLLRI